MGLNGTVIVLEPVVQIDYGPVELPALPLMETREPGAWLAVSGDSTLADAGLFVAMLAEHSGADRQTGAAEAVALVVATETLILPGGLRASDTVTGKSVVPGCCAGLEEWREWADLLNHVSPMMGHDPWPWVEFRVGCLRLWQDSLNDPRRGHRNVPVRVDIPEDELPGLLFGVHKALNDFLIVVHLWAVESGLASSADALTTVIDRHFAVSAPLQLPTTGGAAGIYS